MALKRPLTAIAIALTLGCAHAGPRPEGTLVRMLARDINRDGSVDVILEERDRNNDGRSDLELHYFVKSIEGRNVKLSEPTMIVYDNDFDGLPERIVMHGDSGDTTYELTGLAAPERFELYVALQNLSYVGLSYVGMGSQLSKPRLLHRELSDERDMISHFWDLDGDDKPDIGTVLLILKERDDRAFYLPCPFAYKPYARDNRPMPTFWDTDLDCTIDEQEQEEQPQHKEQHKQEEKSITGIST